MGKGFHKDRLKYWAFGTVSVSLWCNISLSANQLVANDLGYQVTNFVDFLSTLSEQNAMFNKSDGFTIFYNYFPLF